MRTWCIQKQVFIEPINNGYVGPRESVGYLTGLNLNYTFRSQLIRQIETVLEQTETAAHTKMDTSTPTNPTSNQPSLPPRKIELIRTRLHVNTVEN